MVVLRQGMGTRGIYRSAIPGKAVPPAVDSLSLLIACRCEELLLFSFELYQASLVPKGMVRSKSLIAKKFLAGTDQKKKKRCHFFVKKKRKV